MTTVGEGTYFKAWVILFIVTYGFQFVVEGRFIAAVVLQALGLQMDLVTLTEIGMLIGLLILSPVSYLIFRFSVGRLVVSKIRASTANSTMGTTIPEGIYFKAWVIFFVVTYGSQLAWFLVEFQFVLATDLDILTRAVIVVLMGFLTVVLMSYLMFRWSVGRFIVAKLQEQQGTSPT